MWHLWLLLVRFAVGKRKQEKRTEKFPFVLHYIRYNFAKLEFCDQKYGKLLLTVAAAVVVLVKMKKIIFWELVKFMS